MTTIEAGQYFAFSRVERAIAELDGLRAIAILLVLGRHAVWPIYEKSGYLFPAGSWDVVLPLINGWIGVDLFFVLSGFLITLHILRRGGGQSMANFGHYLSARALRIVPSYFAVLALVIAGTIPLYEVSSENLTLRAVYHLLFLQDYFPPNLVVAFWSLGVEEKFYLVAPILVLAAYRSDSASRRYAFLAGLIVLPLIFRAVTAFKHPEINDYYWFFRTFRSPFHVSFDGLAVGVCCAFIYRHRSKYSGGSQPLWPKQLFWLSMILLMLQLFVGELLGQIGLYEKVFQPLVLSLTFGGLLLSVASGGAKGGLLRSKILLIVARISYPLYLIHITFVPLALALSGYTFGASPYEFLRYLAIYSILSFAAAFVLHFSVEKPFLLLKDYLWKSSLK